MDNQIAKANKAISDGLLLGNQFGGGWRSLLQTKKEQCSGKEQKEQFRACGLKEELIFITILNSIQFNCCQC